MTAAGHRAVLAAMLFLTLGAPLIAVQDGDTDHDRRPRGQRAGRSRRGLPLT